MPAGARDELVHVHRRQGRKIVLVHLARLHFAKPGGDQLHRPLKQLRRPLDPHVVAVFERAVKRLRGVPHPRADGPRAVGEFHLEIQVPVAIRTELFLGDPKHLVHRLLLTKLVYVSSPHGGPFRIVVDLNRRRRKGTALFRARKTSEKNHESPSKAAAFRAPGPCARAALEPRHSPCRRFQRLYSRTHVNPPQGGRPALLPPDSGIA